ncbi:MAG: alpha/beta hydrolase, partial [Duncaniella sp.]|nr:alpha/beta hydrolase [Duncaniella sp.]
MNHKVLLLAFALIPAYMAIEAQSMESEAIEFISGMPSDLQVKQENAVRAAINGDCAALDAVRNSRNSPSELPEGVASTDIDGKYRLYSPETMSAASAPLLIYLHGGGWCFGSINSCSRFCSSLVRNSGIKVLAVEYPLA